MRRSCCCTAFSRSSRKRHNRNWTWLKNARNYICKAMNKRLHRGSDFQDFLKDEGILEEVEVLALKRALALQLQGLLRQNSITKSEMAVRMKTSRAAVDRLLDTSNSAITLATLNKAARALG